jgi:beta-glucanase (GH16 family)
VSTGGANAGGSTAHTGGIKASGGTKAGGGTMGTGGSKATGGASSSGGTKPSGSTQTGGGSKLTGGNSGIGGTSNSTGTKAIGGTSNAGGTRATGGNSSGGGDPGIDRCGRPASISVPSGYSKLTWHDEFDVDGAPSSVNWGYETGFVRNNELQWYQSKNAVVSDGLLVITGKRERVTNANYSAGSSDWKRSRQYAEYTAASLTTSGKQTWKFGRFELCAKIPISNGMWPAWWMLGVSGEWPSNGEIDIMEFYKGKILANVACGTSQQWTAKWDSATRSVDSAWAASYHFWRMDWDDEKIDLYVDDSLMNSVPLSTMLNADGKSPFLQNAYMIVNLAIGGDNGGDPANTSFPQEYLIDYLRVFQ